MDVDLEEPAWALPRQARGSKNNRPEAAEVEDAGKEKKDKETEGLKKRAGWSTSDLICQTLIHVFIWGGWLAGRQGVTTTKWMI